MPKDPDFTALESAFSKAKIPYQSVRINPMQFNLYMTPITTRDLVILVGNRYPY